MASYTIQFEGEEPRDLGQTVEQFVADNEMDGGDLFVLKGLEPGEEVGYGGGAAPLVYVRRVS